MLITDGLNNAGPDAVVTEAGRLKTSGVVIFAVGIGADADGDLLRRVADTPDAYYPSPDVGDLAAIHRRIAARLACGRR